MSQDATHQEPESEREGEGAVAPAAACSASSRYLLHAKVGKVRLGRWEGLFYIVTRPATPEIWPEYYWHKSEKWTNGCQDDGNFWATEEEAQRTLDGLRQNH